MRRYKRLSRRVNGAAIGLGVGLGVLWALCHIFGATWAESASAVKTDTLQPAGAKWRISLLTVSPGSEFEERLGHSALAVEDLRNGSAVAYNFGTFGDTPNLVFDFLKKDPRLQFWVASYNPGQIAVRYRQREIRNQELNLTDAQAERLATFMANRVLPPNRRFEYDLFTANCVTPIRDVLDEALSGALHDSTAAPASETYRQALLRQLRSMPLIGALVALAYGPYADAPRSRWEMLFLPDALHDAVATLRVRTTPDTPLQNFVRSEKVWRGDAYETPFPLPNPYILFAGLLLWFLLGLVCLPLFRTRKTGYRLLGGLGVLLLLKSGLIGVGIYYMEFMPHISALHNANRLLFSPFDLAAVPLLFLLTFQRLSFRGTRLLLLLLAATTAIAGFHGLFGHIIRLPSSICHQEHSAVIAWALLGRLIIWLCVAVLYKRDFGGTARS